MASDNFCSLQENLEFLCWFWIWGCFQDWPTECLKTLLKFPCLQCATDGLYFTVPVVLYCVQYSQALIAYDFEEKTTLQLNNNDCLGTKKQVSSDAGFWLLF